MTSFYDAADWHVLPYGQLLALAADGAYAAPPNAGQLLGAESVRWITVEGDYRSGSIIDWEPRNPCFTPVGLRRFVRGRKGTDDNAFVYCDRADAAEALAALGGTSEPYLSDYANLWWWIATLDDTEWTADQLAGDLAANWNAPIPADRLWACQWKSGTFDTSILYRPW